ncbi:hypothetical protein M758_UG085600 [Ceratodon purpureus]|nr:hypothetical protein M758_UG085600 [Ceratodon purpureus]
MAMAQQQQRLERGRLQHCSGPSTCTALALKLPTESNDAQELLAPTHLQKEGWVTESKRNQKSTLRWKLGSFSNFSKMISTILIKNLHCPTPKTLRCGVYLRSRKEMMHSKARKAEAMHRQSEMRSHVRSRCLHIHSSDSRRATTSPHSSISQPTAISHKLHRSGPQTPNREQQRAGTSRPSWSCIFKPPQILDHQG